MALSRFILKYLIWVLLFAACVNEDELQNPFDSKTSASRWKPVDVKVETAGPNRTVLTWRQKAKPISGFEIRKLFGGTESVILLDRDVLEYEDAEVWGAGQTCGKVQYRIRAKAGERASDWVEISSSVDFPSSDAVLAGDDRSSGQLSVPLSAQAPQPWESGVWSVVSGTGGGFSLISDPQAVFTGEPLTLYVLRWTLSGPCGVRSDEIQVATGLPVVVTAPVADIGPTGAQAEGSVTGEGASMVSERGFCWSTAPSPTLAQSKLASGRGEGVFTERITGLTPATTWYVRAYAITPIQTIYGQQVTFTTLPPGLPKVLSVGVDDLRGGSGTGRGEVTEDGGAPVSARGICWGTSPGPTISGTKAAAGSGLGVFSSTLSGLAKNTTYYARAYATNTSGTAYGQEIDFRTPDQPTVSTGQLSSSQSNAVDVSGQVTQDGGDPVSDRGVVFATAPLPDVTGPKVSAGSGVGSFQATVTGLTAGVTYYARTFAVNSWGTAYGEQVTFTTPLPAPALVSPANGESVICCYPIFRWSLNTDAITYEIQVSKNSDFSGTVVSKSECVVISPSVVSSSVTYLNTICVNTGGSSNNGTWYWRVRAFKNSTPGLWSTTGMFSYTF